MYTYICIFGAHLMNDNRGGRCVEVEPKSFFSILPNAKTGKHHHTCPTSLKHCLTCVRYGRRTLSEGRIKLGGGGDRELTRATSFRTEIFEAFCITREKTAYCLESVRVELLKQVEGAVATRYTTAASPLQIIKMRLSVRVGK